MTNLFPAYSSAIGGMKMDCDCEFDKYEDEPDEEPLHYLRTCIYCGEEWYSLHCPHSGYQNPCPECNTRNYKENNMPLKDNPTAQEAANYFSESPRQKIHIKSLEEVLSMTRKSRDEFKAINADLLEALEDIAKGNAGIPDDILASGRAATTSYMWTYSQERARKAITLVTSTKGA